MSNVLVVAAHPDDEVLGCGGTVAKHVLEGDSVDVVIVAEGAEARGATGTDLQQEVRLLRSNAASAATILGTNPPVHLGLPDNRLDTIPRLELIQSIEKQVEHFKPDIVYVHHCGDLNVDHRLVHEAVVTALRPLPDRKSVDILSFETVSSTEWGTQGTRFEPTFFVDISRCLPTKLKALGCYAAEMRCFPHARSREAVEYLASLRGSQIGRSAAEAFVPVRQVIDPA